MNNYKASQSALQDPNDHSDELDRSLWLEAKQIFMQAIAMHPSQRDQFIEAQCGERPITEHVRELLRWHDEEGEFLSPIPRTGSPADGGDEVYRDSHFSGSASLVGRQIGGFLLGQGLGQGSMGTVYEARQIEPDRPAAFKILRGDAFFF